jgi:hypothetical protein
VLLRDDGVCVCVCVRAGEKEKKKDGAEILSRK